MRSMPLSRTILLLAITLAGCWKVDPDLKVSTNQLTFAPTTNELEFTITNDSKDNALTSGVTDLEYQCKCDHAWLTVAPGSGRLREEESITHMVTVDRSRLSLGENLATITVTSNGGNETIEVHAVRTSGNCSSAPTAPTDPSPQDEVFGVDLSANLSWENGESQCEELNATYDVYFGELNPPPLVRNVGSEKSFDPGAMDASTLYYWRVVAKDANGSTAGAIWSFRTGSGTQCTEGPSAPSSLSPANDANDVPLNQNLSWSGGESACAGLTATYDVYFGTDSPPPLRDNTGTTRSWDPGTLEPSRTYYWRVVARDANGSRSSGERKFTTECGGDPDVTAPCTPSPPNGKANVGNKSDLHWECGVVECGDADVTYVVYFGTSSSLDSGDRLGTTKNREWKLPDLRARTTYYWRVVAQAGGSTASSPVWSFTTK